MTEWSARRALPMPLWPEQDKIMVADLFRDDDPLSGSGALAHLRPATRGIYEKDIGFWLGHLMSEGVVLEAEDPGDRFTLDRLRSFDRTIAGLAPATRHSRFTSLVQIMQNARPDHDWSILRKAVARLQRLARGVSTRRKTERIASSAEIVALAEDLIERATSCTHALHRLLLDRDGTMLLFLAYHPIRSRNFGTLELGRTLIEQDEGFQIALPGSETKNHRPDERTVHTTVVRALCHYLRHTRPQLLARSGITTGRVWINKDGGVWAPSKISERLALITRRELGLALNAHLFRDCAVTTTLEQAPDQAWTTRGLLHHAGYETAERHYNHARHIAASKAWADLLDRMRAQDGMADRRRRQCGQ